MFIAVHISVQVYHFLQFQVVSRLKRGLLDLIKLNTLDLYLENWGQLADGAVLFHLGTVDLYLLYIKGTVNCRIDVLRPSGNVDLDIRPRLFFGSNPVFCCNVGDGLAIKQTSNLC